MPTTSHTGNPEGSYTMTCQFPHTILLDRDGIINYDSAAYIKSVEEFRFIPGSLEALVRFSKAHWQIGIATNQSGIARGLYDHQTLQRIHDNMIAKITAAGGYISAIEYCPHLPDAGCACRKPQPGMLFALQKRLGCVLKNTWFVGDKITDIQAALAAGAKPALVTESSSKAFSIRETLYPDVPVFASLAAFTDMLLIASSSV